MGLRLKTTITISSIFLAVIVATYMLFSVSLLNQFRALERARTAKNLERLHQALRGVESDLGHRALDWGHWDESRDFIRTGSKEYIESNLNYEALLPFELQHVIFLRRDGSVMFGVEVLEDGAGTQPAPAHVEKEILSESAVARFISSPSSEALSGLLMIGGVPSFVALSTITDSKAQEEPTGFIIFTRELSPKLQARLGEQTQLQLSFRASLDSAPVFGDGPQASSNTIEEDDETITGLGAIRDFGNRHIVTASFSQPRDIVQQGKATRDSLMLVMATFLLLANGVALLFLDRTVLKPLARFAQRITTISKTNDLTLKADTGRHDEIGNLARSFNSLIDSLRCSHRRLHEARNAAQDANDAKSKFIATVSHELRTPIHSITGMLRILRSQEQGEMKRGYIDMANDAAVGLLDTINEILDFSKAESGSIRLELREFDLRAAVLKASKNISPRKSVTSGCIELIIDVSPTVPATVFGDPHRLAQILTNLLGNACKFTHEGFVALRVDCATARPGDECTITFTVQDSGIGIPADQLPNIFKPFHQGSASTPRLYEGSGLGLSIVQQIVEQMGGEIAAESAEHRGSRFVAAIPFRCEAPAPVAPVTAKRVALITPQGTATAPLAEGFRRHAGSVGLHAPDRPQDVEVLAAQFGGYSHLVLWSPSPSSLPGLRETIVKALKLGLRVSAVLSPEDLAARQQLSSWGAIEFPLKASGIAEILGAPHGQQQRAARQSAESAEKSESPGQPLRVLIADDTPTNCIILQSLLEEAGHSVEVVTNGLDMLNRLRPIAVGDEASPSIDLVLTDVQMPLMDGNTAVKKLRLLEECAGLNRRLPVVAVTAHALPEEQATMRRAGIDEVVTKPISPAELRRVLTSCSGWATEPKLPESANSSVERALKRVVRDLCGGSTDAASRLDIADVFERSGNSMRRTRMILEAFLSAHAAPRDVIAHNNIPRDQDSLARAVHTLKGLLLDVGARRAAVLAGKLEQELKSAAESAQVDEVVARLVIDTGDTASLVARILDTLPRAQEAKA
jgi:signal transduction histidine kinase/CheY-like chemotaxis protein